MPLHRIIVSSESTECIRYEVHFWMRKTFIWNVRFEYGGGGAGFEIHKHALVIAAAEYYTSFLIS